ncbi:MAG TPA: TetR family transcriptional regulator [Herbaspirillum sp.]|jgi:TetR/AcrR family acrAB operon transcriptional repressor
MARSTKEEALETRSRILDAAEDVFYAHGVSQTSLADIAAAADVTRGAIYWHFENKSHLFNAMCERVKLPLEAMMDAETELRATDPLGQFLIDAVQVLRHVVHDPRTRKVFDILFNKCEHVEPDDLIVVRRRESFMKGKTKIKKMLANSIACGQLPANLDIDLAYVMVHATFSGLLHDWLFEPDNFDLSKDAERLFSATIHMVRMAPTLRKPMA